MMLLIDVRLLQCLVHSIVKSILVIQYLTVHANIILVWGKCSKKWPKIVCRWKAPGNTNGMERRWKCVMCRYLICTLIGMDPPMAMALANGFSFIFVFVIFNNGTVFEQLSKYCHHVWLSRELLIGRKAASKSSTREIPYQFVSGVFVIKHFQCELLPTLSFCYSLGNRVMNNSNKFRWRDSLGTISHATFQ